MSKEFDLLGLRIMKTEGMPIEPSDGENARRIVRHGFAATYTDFEQWDGPVGLAPGEPIHWLRMGGTLLCSAEQYLILRAAVVTEDVHAHLSAAHWGP